MTIDALGVMTALDDLHEVMSRAADRLTSSWDYLPRQIAAGHLGQCYSIVRGTLAVNAANIPDVAGILLRYLAESFAGGVVVLLGTHDDLLRLAGDHKRNVRILVDRNELDPSELDKWDFEVAKWPIEHLIARAGELVRETGDELADLSSLYDLLYRAESTFSTHGIGPALKYVEHSSGPFLRLILRPDADGDLYAGLAGLYTSYLGIRVADVFGLDRKPFERVFLNLAAAMGQVEGLD